MPRPLAAEKSLTPEQRRELAMCRAGGATTQELGRWLAQNGVRLTPRQLRSAVERIDRHREKVADAIAFVDEALGPDAPLEELVALAKGAAYLARAHRELAAAPDRPASAAEPKPLIVPPGTTEYIRKFVYGLTS